MTNKIQVILPHVSDDGLSRGLRRIVRAIRKKDPKKVVTCGVFGGEDGYGADFENDTFSMHWDRQFPECDCGGSKPKHKKRCDTITKRSKWLDTRNSIGMVEKQYPGEPGLVWLTSTSTTDQEQQDWMKANPFPKCSCGEELAWLQRNNLKKVPDPDDTYFDRIGSTARKFEHTETCDLSIYEKPHFVHKATGFEVRWYKYIGRDMSTNLAIPPDEWSSMIGSCIRSIKAS